MRLWEPPCDRQEQATCHSRRFQARTPQGGTRCLSSRSRMFMLGPGPMNRTERGCGGGTIPYGQKSANNWTRLRVPVYNANGEEQRRCHARRRRKWGVRYGATRLELTLPQSKLPTVCSTGADLNRIMAGAPIGVRIAGNQSVIRIRCTRTGAAPNATRRPGDRPGLWLKLYIIPI